MNNPVTLTDPSGFAPDGELTWNEEEGERQAGAGGPSGPSGWGWGEGINGNGGAGVGVGDGYTSGGSPVDVIHPGPGPIGAGGGSGGDTGGRPTAGGTPSSDDDNATAPTTSGSGGGATGGGSAGVPGIPINAGQDFWWPVASGVAGAELTSGSTVGDWLIDLFTWDEGDQARYDAMVVKRDRPGGAMANAPEARQLYQGLTNQITAQTPSAAGDLWLAWTSGIQGPKLLTAGRFMDHHVFPQQFRKFFQGKGIDIDQFTVRVEETMHLKGVHGRGLGNMPGRWNARWSEFINSNPSAAAKDIYQFAGRLMDAFGLSGLPIRPYPKVTR